MEKFRKFTPATVSNSHTETKTDLSFTADQIRSYKEIENGQTEVILKGGRKCVVNVPVDEVKEAYLHARNAEGGIQK